MGATKGIIGMKSSEKRVVMSARLPKTQREQLENIAAWYGCSLNEALVHCVNSHNNSLLRAPDKK